MDNSRLRALLESVADGSVRIDEALSLLESFPFEDLGFARVDHHRHLRLGVPEVIFGSGKSASQIIGIAERLLEHGANVLVTRTDNPVFELVHMAMPDARFHPAAGCITIERHHVEHAGTVAVVTAGTTDIPVAEEAAVTAESCGAVVERIFDAGVSGIHRLFAERDRLAGANAIVAVAGMEGALPSVVGGMVAAPVIAVPTSIGYGASFSGLAALLGMLNSCASNVSVVNIDNGFGGGFVAALINRRIESARSRQPADPPGS